jgi:RND family efflux transporter MFP subunit
MRALSCVLACGLLTVVVATAGCNRRAAQPGAAPPLAVPVSQPVRREITDYVDYTGRLDAVQSLDVRARVTGYLVKMPFKEGSEVKKGELLFEIDPRPYQAQYDGAKAQVALADANYRLAQAENARSKVIARRDPGAISTEDLERYAAQEAQAQANLGVTKANLETTKLYLDFTKVTSPIDGMVSRYYYTLGNLVNADQTLLTTVVSYDPMYAYFDMEERVVLRIRNLINAGKIKVPVDRTSIPVLMGLEGEEEFPHPGTIDFVNNTVNPSTGTIAVRGVFANPLPPNGRRLLTPGMFVRIRLPIGSPQPTLLVFDSALGSDQGLKFAYVIDKDNKVRSQRVTIGSLQEDGLRVISNGLKPDDWVVVGALQQVRSGMEISPQKIAMPSLNQPAEAEDKTKDNSQPEQAQPEKTLSDKSQPDKAQPDKAQPDKAQPDKAHPDKAQPDKLQPGEAQPDKAQPGEKKADDKKADDKKADGKE